MSFSHSRSLDCLDFLTFVFCLPLLSFPQSERRKKRHTASSVHRFLLFCFFLALFICQVLFLFVCGVRRVAVAVVSCLPYLSDILHFDDEQPKELRCFTKFGFFLPNFFILELVEQKLLLFFLCVCVRLCVFVHMCMWCASIFFFLLFHFCFLGFSFFFFSPHPACFSFHRLVSTQARTHTHTVSSALG